MKKLGSPSIISTLTIDAFPASEPHGLLMRTGDPDRDFFPSNHDRANAIDEFRWGEDRAGFPNRADRWTIHGPIWTNRPSNIGDNHPRCIIDLGSTIELLESVYHPSIGVLTADCCAPRLICTSSKSHYVPRLAFATKVAMGPSTAIRTAHRSKWSTFGPLPWTLFSHPIARMTPRGRFAHLNSTIEQLDFILTRRVRVGHSVPLVCGKYPVEHLLMAPFKYCSKLVK